MKVSTLATTLSLLLLGTAAMAENRSSKILTADIATKVLGCPVKASMENDFNDTEMGKIWVSNADYSEKDGKRTAHLLIRHAASKEEATTTFSQSKATFKGVDVPGIGDAAYRTAQPAQLDVLKGQNWLIISVGPYGKPDTAGQEALAKEVLPKVAPN